MGDSMKRSIKMGILLVSALCTLLAGCSKQKNPVEEIKKKGKFIVGLDASFPPMGFVDEQTNEICGYDIDLAKEVAKRLGVEFEAQPIVWNNKINILNEGSIDCIWSGFTITPQREEECIFSFPYLKNEQVLVVKNDSQIKSLKDMKNKTVGAQKESTAIQAIHASPALCDNILSVMIYDDNIAALNDLEKGNVDGIVLDSVVADYLVSKSEYTFREIDETLSEENYGIGFKKGNELLCQEIQNILLQMKAEGTITAISIKWFGKDISLVE